jgi:YVTN family beta-propeller protein
VAVNPVTNKIYVANNGSANVTVINGADNSTATVAAGTNPAAVAVNPVTNKSYVANLSSNNVTVINGADNSTATVAAGTNPQAVAVNPVTNKIYVANGNSANVTVINGADNSTATVAAGTSPFAVAVNPVTNRIYVANENSNNVTVINGADNSTATVAAGTTPFAVAVNPVTNKIYVANEGSANVTVINGADNSTATVAVGANPRAVAVNPVTNKIYVANFFSANVTVINGADNSTATVVVGTFPIAAAVNPVSNKIYVANEGSANLTVINGADNSTATVTAGTTPPLAVAVNPVTNKIYVAYSGSANVTVINGADNSTATVAAGTNPQAVAVNPVTNKIYVANNGSDNVTAITEQNTQPIPLTVAINLQSGGTPRTFGFTVTDNFSPTAPPVQQVYYQVDTWQGAWSAAAPSGNTSQSGQIPAQQDGVHIIYAYATEGEDATSTNTGGGSSPLIGQISALVFLSRSSPTAAPAGISGQVTTPDGSPLAGVVMRLSGGESRATITDGNGFYSFGEVELGSFYSVAPELANYSFTPQSRSFSLLADRTDAVFTGAANAVADANPLDTDMYFVREQYLDFLGREPDQEGLDYWSAALSQCNGDAACLSAHRIEVSAAFFASVEFQQSGSYMYRLYRAGLGRQLSYAEFKRDHTQVLGGADLDASQAAFADSFVQRAEFVSKYAESTTAETLVDALLQNIAADTGVDLSSQRTTLIALYLGAQASLPASSSSLTQPRSAVLQSLANNAGYQAATLNPAFVLMQYFGYLQRDADQGGYSFWLNVLNRDPSNYRGMVCSFITSAEYQQRFSSVVTHSNAECGP